MIETKSLYFRVIIQQKNDIVLVISSKEFRDKQKNYLDKVDEGVEIYIQRDKDRAYKIIPVKMMIPC